jgi:hypothetical protein
MLLETCVRVYAVMLFGQSFKWITLYDTILHITVLKETLCFDMMRDVGI